MLRDRAGSHPQKMGLFKGFTVGYIGKEKIIDGKVSSNSDADKR